MCFAAEILRRGWRISRPYGDSAPYDCVVDVGGHVSRVQIKCATKPALDARSNHHGPYHPLSNHGSRTTDHHYKVCIAKGSRKKSRYRSSEVDFIAILVVPLRCWYIIPLHALKGQVSISLGPGQRFAKYREAWHLLTIGL